MWCCSTCSCPISTGSRCRPGPALARGPHKVAASAVALTAVRSVVASGLIALRRRRENRTGLYRAGVGHLWFFGALGDANNDTVWTASLFVSNLAFIPFAA